MFHIGSARTALFNWLYARHTGGTFILRIEDTDAARNKPEYVEVIFHALKWLGMDWDEGPQPGGAVKGDKGPYFQSQRAAIYKGYVDRLLSEGKAYESDGAVKFRTPKTPITVPDLICGSIQFDRTNEPDLVIQRKDGSPVFHLVNVVDDIEMAVTHVIRGEDHLSNTQKHLALIEAIRRQAAALRAHPADPESERLEDEQARRRRLHRGLRGAGLSSRGGAQLSLPARLVAEGQSRGHSHRGSHREVRPAADRPRQCPLRYRQAFLDQRRVHARRAARSASSRSRSPSCKSTASSTENYDPAYFRAALAIVKEKIKLGRELPEWMAYFFNEDFPYDEAAVKKVFTPEGLANIAQAAGAARRARREGIHRRRTWKRNSRRSPPRPARKSAR